MRVSNTEVIGRREECFGGITDVIVLAEDRRYLAWAPMPHQSVFVVLTRTAVVISLSRSRGGVYMKRIILN